MSLKDAAHHLASKGRGPDTLLVHMAPSEVAGMQALAKAAGGSLTVNPDTGLPEAGFLESLLPTIIGAGVTAATGGAAAPWMIGAGLGGLQALRTGSLTKGLSAGLGAYGGAGLAGGLAGLGTGALSQQAGAAASQGLEGLAADQAAEQAIKERLANATVMDKLKAGMGTFEWNKPMDFVSGLGGGDKKRGALMLGAAALPTVMQAVTPEQTTKGPVTDSTMPRRLRYDINSRSYVPISQQEAFNLRGFAAGGMPEWNPKWTPDTPGYGNQGQDFGREILYYNAPPAAEVEQAPAKPIDLKPAYDRTGDGAPGGAENAPQSTPDWGMLDKIGVTLSNYGLPSVGDYLSARANEGRLGTEQVGAGRVANPMGLDPSQRGQIAIDVAQQARDEAGDRANPGPIGGVDTGNDGGGYGEGLGAGYDKANGGMIGHYASGGLGSLGSYSDGGRLLRGPGDGVSDSIPATIGHKQQPARLADGEFVVPARIVSELGNGSTEAGARKLYAMMDRIQKARRKSIGAKQVAVDSKAHKLLPA